MEQKTKVKAESGKQEILIIREFELPVELLFKAYTESELVEQWMGNKVLKMDSRPHGSYEFETRDRAGNVLFRANGVIHEFVPNQKITRTFEMENTPFPVQLEFLEFTKITTDRCQLTIHVIYKTVNDRDQLLQMPFAAGINMAHDLLEKIMNQTNI
ncbi:SRPBCC family protein [Sphingobacterium sp. SYP-B4668]|uniref:SRPBCC family protein n=1 Tax=Sphingobacterium sp. SYP-B4668 TaxID=2996035 RepID=UPI0022DD5762|nr:SRPBCC domain-containing protein [Sphingobacterium sp. SYP-B4668]